jgi:putative CocE/NonD family hydrolase
MAEGRPSCGIGNGRGSGPIERHGKAGRGHANTRKGDGTLNLNLPGSEPFDQFTFDPANPCSSGLLPNKDGKIRSLDQRKVERRDDVLVFTTSPLKKAIEVTGPVLLYLYAATSAKDTDFTGKLVDVYPNGLAMHLTSGILRTRFRESYEKPSLIKPGRIYAYRIELWATSNLFRPHHRIRLEVSSSLYPEFLPNTNTGGNIGSDTATLVAKQTIHHDVHSPSNLLLPIIPA